MNKEITFFVKKLLLFFVFSLLFYIIMISVWGTILPYRLHGNIKYNKGSYGHLYTRIKEIPNFKNVDLLFLGSSHTYRGFDNRIFKEHGYSSYNLGSSAQTPLQTYVLLNRHLEVLNPKIIIFEVYPDIFSSDGIESSLDIIANTPNDVFSFQMAIKQKHITVFNTMIYGSFRDFLKKDLNFKESIIKGNDVYVPGGYVEKKLGYHTPQKRDSSKWDLNSLQFKYLKKCIELAKNKKIKVILVMAPMTKNLYHCKTNNIEFDKKIKSYGEYYNFNDILHLNDSLHFYDEHHLNQNGVKLFNEAFIKLMKEEELLPKN